MDYSVDLKKVNFFRTRSLLVTVLYLPYGIIVYFISKTFNFSDLLMLALISVYFVIVIYCGLKWTNSECPNCHKLFFGFSLIQNLFTDKCLNCGLELEKGKEKNA
jgi:hypothetical protein